MTNTVIWKHTVPVDDQDHRIRLAAGAKVLHVGCQFRQDEVQFWEGHPDNNHGQGRTRTFRVFGTGQPVTNEYIHVGTCTVGPFVWHLFERY